MINEILNTNFIKITVSSPVASAEYEKISIRPIIIKGKDCYQAERFKENKVFHLNISKDEIKNWLEHYLPYYSQICLFTAGKTVTFFVYRLP